MSGTQKWTQEGLFTSTGLTVTITEIPTTYDHAKYEKVLDELQEKGTISSWKDETSDGFKFVVKMKRGFKMKHESIIKTLKLSRDFTQNINVIDHKGLLKHYDHVNDLIEDFVVFRMNFLNKRIQHGIESSIETSMLANAKVAFIDGVSQGNIVLSGKTKSQLTKELKQFTWAKDYVTILLSMSFDKLTTDEKAKLIKEAQAASKQLRYWKNTCCKDEFLKDLKEL